MDAMQADDRVFIYGLDVPDHKRIFGSTRGILEKFGSRRCFGTPISEEAMTGLGIGAAIEGLRPIHVHIRVDFLVLALNQLINMASNIHYLSGGQLKVPLVIRAVIGRGWGQGAQHSKSLQSVFAHIPGLKVIMPSTAQDAYSLLRASIEDDNPVVFLEHRWLFDVSGEVDRGLKQVLGKAHVRRQGKDLTLITTSWMTVEAMKAAQILSREGIDIEVVDVRSIMPLDTQTLVDSVSKTKRCLVADYDWSFCGFSAEVASQIQERCFDDLKGPVARLGFAHTPCPTTRPLENLFYPSAKTMIEKIEEMLGLQSMDLSKEEFYSWEHKFKGPF